MTQLLAPWSPYPAASRGALSEPELAGAYARAVVRREPCACRADVVQRAGDTIPEALSRHQAGRRHQEWRTGADR